MRKYGYLSAIIILCLAIPCVYAGNANLEQTLGALPNSCSLVIGCAEVQKTMAAADKWIEPLDLLPEIEGAIRWMMASIGTTVRGPAVFGLLDEQGTFVFVLQSDKKPGDIAAVFNEHLVVNAVGDRLVFGRAQNPWLQCVVSQGMVIGSNNQDTLNRFLRRPVDSEASILATEDGAKLLLSADAADANLFVFKRPGLVSGFDPFRTEGRARPAAALGRHMLAATHIGWLVESPSLACLTIGDADVTLKTRILLPVEASLPERPNLAQSVSMKELSSAWPLRISGHHGGFVGIMDGLERAMERFDPDVAAEYREEMAELDRDLGYDFRKDFLGALGNQWAFGLQPSTAGGSAEWVLVCELLDREKFVASAAKLAEISSEPWGEVLPMDDALRFTSRAFTMPLAIGVTEKMVVLGSSTGSVDDTLRALSVSDTKPSLLEGTSFWDISVALDVKEFVGSLPPDAMPMELVEMIALFPESPRVKLQVHRRGQEYLLELGLEGAGSREIGGWFAGEVDEAREKARRKACLEHVSQILKACFAYEADHKRLPNRLKDLLPAYMATEESFQCPSARGSFKGEGNGLPSYRFLGGVDSRILGASTMIVYDLKQNHGEGRNVGYFDGHTRWVDEASFAAELEQSLRSVTLAIERLRQRGDEIQVDMKRIEAFYRDQPIPE